MSDGSGHGVCGATDRAIYRALLRLYPRAFRERFEAEMLALFAQTAAAAPHTVRGRVALWRATLADLLPSAARERLSSKGSLSMAPLASDVLQAWRVVRRAPLVTAFVVLLMALSIGSTTAVFSIVNAVLLRPYPFARPDRLVVVWEKRGPENMRNGVGGHEFPVWQARARSFERLAAIAFDRQYNLTGGGDPLKLVVVRTTWDFFPVMGVPAELGRGYGADEDRPGNGQVVVISDRLWRDRFAADPSILGRSILLSGTPFTVIGVMPQDFRFPAGEGGADPDVWTPIAEPIQRYRGRHYLSIVGRLRDGVTIAQAQAEMDALAAAIAKDEPQLNDRHGVNVQPLHGEMVFTVRASLLLLFGGVALVLLIGCCNVANLLLARAASRQQEMAVRMALGAGRLRLARQLLAEGGALAVLGGTGGVLLAWWLIALARASATGDVPRLQSAQLDATVLAFAAGVSVLTALVFGLVPLAQAVRVDVSDRLKHGSKGIARPLRQPLRRALVVAEVALTVAVATSAGLLLQSFGKLMAVDPGFNPDGVLAAEVSLPARYGAAPAQRAFFDEAIARARMLPGVTSAAATNMVPQGGGISGIAVAAEGRPAPPPDQEISVGFRVVSEGYFETLGIPLTAGRGFTPRDARAAVPLIRWFPQQPYPPRFAEPQAPPVAVINEAMARHFWPGESPLGRRFTVLSSPLITVIGVVKDSRNRALADEPWPEFYLTHTQEPQSGMTLLLRAPGALAALPPSLRTTIWSIDRDLPVAKVRTLAAIVNGNLALFRAIAWLMGAFAVVALALMALGVYAVVSYTAAQRTYEIGVRLALGAQRRDIRRLVILNGAGLAILGIVLGVWGAYALARLSTTLLYEIAPADPFTYASLSALVLAIALAATWVPARRAQRVDPVSVLRSE
jgi:putative ABC transport system permease protein